MPSISRDFKWLFLNKFHQLWTFAREQVCQVPHASILELEPLGFTLRAEGVEGLEPC